MRKYRQQSALVAAAFGLILLVASAAGCQTPVVYSATGADVPATVAAFRNAYPLLVN